MAATYLNVHLFRNENWIAEIRCFGGNNSDVRFEYFKYTKITSNELKQSFPNTEFIKGDKVVITSKWGKIEKIIE